MASDQSRKRAIEIVQHGKDKGISLINDVAGLEVMLADLHRRSGQFDQVGTICEEGLAKNPQDTVRQMLIFEKALAFERDPRCYTIEAAMQHQESNPRDQ